MIFARVDFPAPFSPTRPCSSPSANSRSTPRSACTPAKDLTIPTARTAAGGLSGAPAASRRFMSAFGASELGLPFRDVRLGQDARPHGLRDDRRLARPHRPNRLLAGDQVAEHLLHGVEPVVVGRDDVRRVDLPALDELDPQRVPTDAVDL